MYFLGCSAFKDTLWELSWYLLEYNEWLRLNRVETYRCSPIPHLGQQGLMMMMMMIETYRAKIAFRAKIVLDLLIELKPCSFSDTRDITLSCQGEVNVIRPVSYGNDCFLWLQMDKTQQTDERQNCSCTRSWRVLLLGFQRQYLKRVRIILMKWSMRNQRMMESILRYNRTLTFNINTTGY